jgi:hypothetical protein
MGLRMSADTKGRTLGLLILGIIVVGICSNTFSGVVQAFKSQYWPRTVAHVTESVVTRDATDVAPRWTPAVEYRYNVGNNAFTSHRVRFLMAPIYQREQATEITDAYGAGRDLRIAYNPANPSESVLEPGLQPGTWKQLLSALFLLSITGYIFYEIHHPERRVLLRSVPDDFFGTPEPDGDRSEAA